MLLRPWRVKIEREYLGRAVEVRLWRRWQIHEIVVATVMVRGDDFDTKMAEAIADARAKAITLNGAMRHAARKFARRG